MKNLIRITACSIVAILFATMSYAQIDFNHPKFAKYGTDAQTREDNYKNYSFFKDDVSMKNYSSAEKRLEELLVNAPTASENIYIKGISVYKNLYNLAPSPAQKNAYFDKIIKLYDMRDKYFGGKKSYIILANRSLDLMRYRPKNIPAIRKSVAQTIDKSNEKVNLSMCLQYFNIITNEYIKNSTFDASVLLEDFDMVSEAAAKSTNSNKDKVLASLDELLLQSGATNCDNLEKLFKPKFKASPNDADLVKKIVGYLVRNDCESAFATQISEKYYEINPSSESAFALAIQFAGAKDDTKAVKYFKESISNEDDQAKLENYLIRFAAHELQMNRPMNASGYARKVIRLNNSNSLGYMLLAQSFSIGASHSGCSGFDRKAIYYIVVDNLYKAKKYSNDEAEVGKINSMIRTYSSNFPSREDIFYKELEIGASYRVNCGWINGVTTVRSSN
ncbi:MAG: hypothetical protein IMY73_01685 [Bacteroidetes bacterium]|nr:hypothetical protein [Bacteroidota bacterium]